MKRLKEILAERKRAAQSTPVVAVETQPDNQVAEQVPAYVYSEPMNEFEALFADCTEF